MPTLQPERLKMTPRELAKWRAERRRNERAGREAGPKADIIKLLEERGVRFFRMQSGDIMGKNKQGRTFRVQGNVAGTPDILVLGLKTLDNYIDGAIPIWLEIKRSKGGKPSPEQLEFQQHAEALGESYLICRSAEELGKWLDSNL